MKQVELVNGDLRFPALLTGGGEPVLLLHGFPDTHENWADIMQRLARAGYTAVAPALRGYAPSCQPGSGDYALTAALEDLMAFTDQLGGRLHLVGHDWGAVLGYLACARYPETFSTFSALAIPPLKRLPQALLRVPEQLGLSAYIPFFQLPLAAETWLNRNDLDGVATLWRRWSPGWEAGRYLEQAKHTLAQPGVLSAALGWYRHLPRLWRRDLRQASKTLLGETRVPTQVLLGESDGCMSPRLLDHTIYPGDFPEGLYVKTLADAGHFLHLQQPDAVAELLVEHIRKEEKKAVKSE